MALTNTQVLYINAICGIGYGLTGLLAPKLMTDIYFKPSKKINDYVHFAWQWWGIANLGLGLIAAVVARKASKQTKQAVIGALACPFALGSYLFATNAEYYQQNLYYQGLGLCLSLVAMNAYFGFAQKDDQTKKAK